MVVVMFVLDPLLALVVVAAVIVFLVTSSGSSKRITTASRRTRRSEGQLANTAQEALATIKVVQAYGLEELILDRFIGANRDSLRTGVRSLRLASGTPVRSIRRAEPTPPIRRQKGAPRRNC